MVMIGADADELEQMGRTFAQADQQLGQLAREISGILQRTSWSGPDANRFRTEWQSRLSGQLTRTGGALSECRAALAQNAQEQRRTSDEATGSAGIVNGSRWPNPLASVLDRVSKAIDGVGKGEGIYSVLNDLKEGATLLAHGDLPPWATKLSKGLRAFPGLGLGISVGDAEVDVIKHLAKGDLFSDKAVGEFAFDVASIGLSTAELLVTPADVVGVGVLASLALGGANVALSFSESSERDEAVGRVVKESVGQVVGGAGAVASRAEDAAGDILRKVPLIPIIRPLPVPMGALQLAGRFLP